MNGLTYAALTFGHLRRTRKSLSCAAYKGRCATSWCYILLMYIKTSLITEYQHQTFANEIIFTADPTTSVALCLLTLLF